MVDHRSTQEHARSAFTQEHARSASEYRRRVSAPRVEGGGAPPR